MKRLIAIIKQDNQTLVFYFDKGQPCNKTIDLPINQMIDGLCEFYHTSFKSASQYIKKKHKYTQKVPIYLGDSVYFPTQGCKDPQAWINYNLVSNTKKINEYETYVYFKPFMLIETVEEYKLLVPCNVRVIKHQLDRCERIVKKGKQTQQKYRDCFKN